MALTRSWAEHYVKGQQGQAKQRAESTENNRNLGETSQHTHLGQLPQVVRLVQLLCRLAACRASWPAAAAFTCCCAQCAGPSSGAWRSSGCIASRSIAVLSHLKPPAHQAGHLGIACRAASGATTRQSKSKHALHLHRHRRLHDSHHPPCTYSPTYKCVKVLHSTCSACRSAPPRSTTSQHLTHPHTSL